MAWTQADLTALETAIASGSRRVRYQTAGGEREVQYRSLEEMLSLRRLMRIELGLFDPAGQRRTGVYSKGLVSGGKTVEGSET